MVILALPTQGVLLRVRGAVYATRGINPLGVTIVASAGTVLTEPKGRLRVQPAVQD